MEPIRGNTIIKERMLYDTFYEFKKLIIRHYSFLQHGKDKCCNYINYWLNKKVRESDYRVDKQNFEIFDKFMRVDAKIKGSSIDCVSKLSYMDTDTFEKMKKLYDLYDYFSDLKKSENPSSLCKNISFLAEKYESAFKKCNENDNYFCKMLTSLKDIKQKNWKEKHQHWKTKQKYWKEKHNYWKSKYGKTVTEHYQNPQNNFHNHYHDHYHY
ncbi:hypothetical protein PVBG_06204 [Plasmodium vivax Brazil I]|uniref:Uncharacterized protein n=1 Tax=Plasmodium vivax (strain Brazil I) TaxID=1033975 RepID=A0A0J9SK60_PLAV1|nr:hypothetical protein PVBG_06204 [Plasmodium vivax Brazil I]